jgi:hypothetical protein
MPSEVADLIFKFFGPQQVADFGVGLDDSQPNAAGGQVVVEFGEHVGPGDVYVG